MSKSPKILQDTDKNRQRIMDKSITLFFELIKLNTLHISSYRPFWPLLPLLSLRPSPRLKLTPTFSMVDMVDMDWDTLAMVDTMDMA